MTMIESVLLTGASRGIGAATLRKMASESTTIGTFVTVARPSTDYDELIAEVRKLNPNKTFLQLKADLSSLDDVSRVLSEIKQAGIEVHGVINNAGYTNPKSIQEIVIDDFYKTLTTNLVAPFAVIQGLLKTGRPPKLIINVASTAGMNGRPGWLTYSASKAALINMSEVLREEMKPYGTRVVCVSPGRCATALRRTLAPDEDPSTIMQPEDVADILSILASPSGRMIDSQNLVIRT